MDNKIATPYLDHARVEMAHCLADGLFLPTVQRVGGKIPVLNLSYQYGKDKITYWWRNYESLDVKDMCVFLAIHRMAVESARGITVEINPTSQDAIAMRELFQLKAAAEKETCIMVETSLTEIARIVGIGDSGQNLKNIMLSLVRMSSVMLALYKPNDMINFFWQASLINKFDKIDNGHLVVGLNPRLASAILCRPTTYIDMREFREIKNKVTKRLYVWLSAWANTSHATRISLDNLIPHIWGKVDVLNCGTVRNRRRALRVAIADIAGLQGWACSLDVSTQMVRVQKPKFVR